MVIPLKLNPVPLIDAWEIVTLVAPVLVMVSEAVCCEPTSTLPKASLVGLAVSCPSAIPVPESAMLVLESDASLEMVTFELKVPAPVGVNATLKFVLCPTGTLTGKDGAVTAKPLPVTVALLMLTVEEPRFVAMTVIVLVLPAMMLPKLRVVLPSERLPGCGWVELLLFPALNP